MTTRNLDTPLTRAAISGGWAMPPRSEPSLDFQPIVDGEITPARHRPDSRIIEIVACWYCGERYRMDAWLPAIRMAITLTCASCRRTAGGVLPSSPPSASEQL